MAAFRQKKIKHQANIGYILREARQSLGLSLDVVAKKLQIKKSFLESIEDSDFEVLPGVFYAKIYTKKYADFLGVRFKKIEEGLDYEIERVKKWQNKNRMTDRPTKSSFVVMPQIIRKGLIFVIVLGLLSYLSLQVGRIVTPPDLVILSPASETEITNNNTYAITGQTDPNAEITINSEKITPDETGYFSLVLDLSSGSNIIRVTSKKKYSKSIEKQLEIIHN